MATSTTTQTSAQNPAATTDRTHLAPALSAMLLGCGLIFLVGFAPIAAVHNAAHDTRHSAAFPCH